LIAWMTDCPPAILRKPRHLRRKCCVYWRVEHTRRRSATRASHAQEFHLVEIAFTCVVIRPTPELARRRRMRFHVFDCQRATAF